MIEAGTRKPAPLSAASELGKRSVRHLSGFSPKTRNVRIRLGAADIYRGSRDPSGQSIGNDSTQDSTQNMNAPRHRPITL